MQQQPNEIDPLILEKNDKNKIIDYAILQASAKTYLPYIGYSALWSIIAAAEAGYGAMLFNTSENASHALIKSIMTLTDNKLSLQKLDEAMNYINIICSLANTILTPLSLLNIKKQIHDAQVTWKNGKEKCLNNKREKIIFFSNLSIFTFASISAALPISAALFDLLGYQPGILVLGAGGFIAQVALFWLVGSSFIFDVPEKLQHFPESYHSILRNVFSINTKSIPFILRSLIANSTRFIKMYGAAAYSLKYLLPNYYNNLIIPYGLMTSITHTHDCFFTQTAVDYETTFGGRSTLVHKPQEKLEGKPKIFMYGFKSMFFFLLAAMFISKLLSATGLLTDLIVGEKENFSIGESLACLAMLVFQTFGAYQQVIFVRNGFTDPLSITMAKKVSKLGLFKESTHDQTRTELLTFSTPKKEEEIELGTLTIL